MATLHEMIMPCVATTKSLCDNDIADQTIPPYNSLLTIDCFLPSRLIWLFTKQVMPSNNNHNITTCKVSTINTLHHRAMKDNQDHNKEETILFVI